MTMHRETGSVESLPCIWMDAGVVAFKLCDRGFDCEHCPFDVAMRGEHRCPGSIHDAEDDIRALPVQPAADAHVRANEIVTRFFDGLTAISFPEDRTFHPGHTWAQALPDGSVRVGLDHVASRFIGMASTVVLPPRSSLLVRNLPFAWVVEQEGSHTLHAPVSGRLAERNSAVMEHPHLLSEDPYDAGWLVRLSGADLPPAEKSSAPETASGRVRDELAALRADVLAHVQQMQQAGATLYDGGVHVSTVHDLLGPKRFFKLASRLFQL
jgi:glycine cleavage system H protein